MNATKGAFVDNNHLGGEISAEVIVDRITNNAYYIALSGKINMRLKMRKQDKDLNLC
jgi:hypothetical protein